VELVHFTSDGQDVAVNPQHITYVQWALPYGNATLNVALRGKPRAIINFTGGMRGFVEVDGTVEDVMVALKLHRE
jgi:hypothetical protein